MMLAEISETLLTVVRNIACLLYTSDAADERTDV